MTRTFWAWGPFGPVVTSNSTLSFSCRFRKPEPEMALKWTKTSGPDSCVMNPNPLSPLNHLTVPVVMDNPSIPGLIRTVVRAAGRRGAAEGTARNLLLRRLPSRSAYQPRPGQQTRVLVYG